MGMSSKYAIVLFFFASECINVADKQQFYDIGCLDWHILLLLQASNGSPCKLP